MNCYKLKINNEMLLSKTSILRSYFIQCQTTFDFNFDLYQAFKQHGYTETRKRREAANKESFSLITCKPEIRQKSVNNQNINQTSFFVLI